jgi:hypothetical protein
MHHIVKNTPPDLREKEPYQAGPEVTTLQSAHQSGIWVDTHKVPGENQGPHGSRLSGPESSFSVVK